MFSFTKKSFSFKVYITGNREFLPRKPQICLIHSSKLQDRENARKNYTSKNDKSLSS